MAENKSKDAKQDDGEESTAVVAPKKSKKTLFIIIGAVALLLIVAVVLFIVLGSKKEEPVKSAEKVVVDVSNNAREEKLMTETEPELEEGEELLGALVPLDPFVLNLKGGRFIKFQMQLEFIERDIPKKFYMRASVVRDGIITLINNRTADDVLDREGKEKLRKDLKNLINEALRKELVKQIYFTQFVVQ